MQEMIDKIVNDLGKTQHYPYPTVSEILTEHLPTGTIYPSQFVNGEPTEDGEYLCIIKGHEKNYYEKVTRVNGEHWATRKIISHCKLP